MILGFPWLNCAADRGISRGQETELIALESYRGSQQRGENECLCSQASDSEDSQEVPVLAAPGDRTSPYMAVFGHPF